MGYTWGRDGNEHHQCVPPCGGLGNFIITQWSEIRLLPTKDGRSVMGKEHGKCVSHGKGD